jgi:hypothetical protein
VKTGVTQLRMLRDRLGRRELTRRGPAFDEAERWIVEVGGDEGVSGPISRSFPRRKPERRHRTARVDIEVIKGTAFGRGMLFS